jgi:hypothetical protein
MVGDIMEQENPTNTRTRDEEHPEWDGMRAESKKMTRNSGSIFSYVQWKRITYIRSQLDG